MKYPNFDKLKEYVNQEWVISTKHSSLPLTIYNYSRKTQFEKKWDDITLDCRGLVLDNEGNIIAKCFSKFFNYEEVRYKDIPIHETPIIQEKVDGSLGIIFYYNNEWHVATRGSFHSIQAQKGKELLYSKYKTTLGFLNYEYTYLVEIIYPENRIVVNYGNDEKLIWLSIFDNKTGEELSNNDVHNNWVYVFLTPDDVIDSTECEQGTFGEYMFSELKNNQKENKEGYIIKFEPSGYRIKIKFEDYIALHKIITNITSYDVWEYLKDEKDISELIEKVPDELDNWVKLTLVNLNKQFIYIEGICLEHYNDLRIYSTFGYWSRKEQALWIKNNVIPRYQGIVFHMLNNKDYKEQIWKLCKPKYEKPFAQF